MRAGAGIARRYLVVGLPERAGYVLGGLTGNPGVDLPGRAVAVKGLKSAMAAATAPPWPTGRTRWRPGVRAAIPRRGRSARSAGRRRVVHAGSRAAAAVPQASGHPGVRDGRRARLRWFRANPIRSGASPVPVGRWLSGLVLQRPGRGQRWPPPRRFPAPPPR